MARERDAHAGACGKRFSDRDRDHEQIADRGIERVFDEPACVIVKHANPCGVASAATLAEAWDLAFRCDPISPFGGIVAVNRELGIGLWTFEGHYALYPPGAGYARHRDRFRDDDARVLSCVLYLNAGWRPDDGGALRLHFDDGGALDVAPDGGTLVAFLAEAFEHEVLPGRRPRVARRCRRVRSCCRPSGGCSRSWRRGRRGSRSLSTS
jgi:hypothetical protein